MRTIVINTSKEAINTKLDVLFKAPFDKNCLLWFDCDITELDGIADSIKRTLINDTDIVDRDYNLIVLVDLYHFPKGNRVDAVKLYERLLLVYINKILITKLAVEYDLKPLDSCVFFADSSKSYNDFDPDDLVANPIEQERLTREAAVDNDMRQEADDKGDLVDVIGLNKAEKAEETERSNWVKLLMEMFSWTEDSNKSSIKWNLRCSIEDDSYLYFSNVFEYAVQSVQKSDESASCVSVAIDSIKDILNDIDSENPDVPFDVNMYNGVENKVHHLIYSFPRENEQNIIEGFFKIYANVFACIQSKAIITSVRPYDLQEIKDLFEAALKKYRFFSSEDNIKVALEPIDKIFEKKEVIWTEWLKNKKRSGMPSQTADQVADEIMAKEPEGKESLSLDKAFNKLVSQIYDNYDEARIKEQNDKLIEKCMAFFWDWRDKQSVEEFKKIIDIRSEELKKDAPESRDRCDISFLQNDYDAEYGKLIEEITAVDSDLAGNKNILRETKSLIIRYSDLMRKGKVYLMSSIGAVIAVLISVFPYIYVQFYSDNENVLHRVLYILFIFLFVFLYSTASGIYIKKINGQKRELKNRLKELKDESENERRESIKALFNYYSDVIVRAEGLRLLWQDLSVRNRENAKKCIKRNSHKKRLEKLAGVAERFITMLKFKVGPDAANNSNDDEKNYDALGLKIDCDESFYSANNQKVYSILALDDAESQNEGGEETL